MSTEHAELRPVGVAEAIRNNIVIVGLLTLVGLALGLVGASREAVRHSATTPILIQPLQGNPYYPTRTGELLTNLLTEAQAVRSQAVAESVAPAIGYTGEPGALLKGVSVTSPVNTQVLEITYEHGDEDVALQRSQAFADAYLEYRRARAAAEIEHETTALDEQIDPITERIAELGAALSDAPAASADAQIAIAEIGALANQRAALQARRAEVAAQPTSPGQVITPAELDAGGLVDTRLLLPIAGTLLGLIAGVVAAILRARADQVLRDADAVRDAGLPVIGTIGGLDPRLDAAEADAVLEDQYRKLRVALLALEQRRPFSLVLAGAGEGQHAPTAAIDLAASFARAGLNTVLIDVTEFGDGPAHVLASTDAEGLAELLLGSSATAPTPVAPMLWLVAPGRDVSGAADLFVSDEMAATLNSIKQQGEVVVIATGSIQHANAQSMASMADAIALEVRDDVTRPELDRALHTLDVLPCTLLGAVWVGGDVPVRTPGFRPETTPRRREAPERA